MIPGSGTDGCTPARQEDAAADLPLCVDLDGTLIYADLLLIGTWMLLRRTPVQALALPGWLARGKAYLKQNVASVSEIDPAGLAYNPPVLRLLADAKAKGRTLCLVTAAAEKNAMAVASFLGVFDNVFASTSTTNLSGKHKASLLVDKFGRGGFDYVGNSFDDLPVWRVSRACFVVRPSPRLERVLRDLGNEVVIVS